MAPPGQIAQVPKGAVHRIASGQVILDLSTAVKELLENALDAGATNIEVKLKEYGSELIEVADNGSGIAEQDYQALTLKYHTSKISQLSDLEALASFGFRGEALSSLCAVSEVTVATRTEGSQTGTRLSYDHAGVLTGTAAAARSKGTTVAIRELFKPLPVRYKELRRHLKREYAKLLGVLQAYALIAAGVRIICTNQVGTGARTKVISTQGLASMRDNIITIFGGRTSEALKQLDGGTAEGIAFEGYVSGTSASFGKTGCDRQYFYLNGRPVDMPKFARVLLETYRACCTSASAQHSRPMAVINIKLPSSSYDINVTPDKRKALLHREQEVLDAFQEALTRVWDPTGGAFDPQTAMGTQHIKSVSQVPAATAPTRQQVADESEESSKSGEEGAMELHHPDQPPHAGRSGAAKRPDRGVSLPTFARRGASGAAALTAPARRHQQSRQPLLTTFLSPIDGREPTPSAALDRGSDAGEAVVEPAVVPATCSGPRDAQSSDAHVPAASQLLDHEALVVRDGHDGSGTPGDAPSEEGAAIPAVPLFDEAAPAPEGATSPAPCEGRRDEQGRALSNKESDDEQGAGKRRRLSECSDMVMPLDMEAIRAAWSSPCEAPLRGNGGQGTSSYSAASIKDDWQPAGDAADSELERVFQKSDFARMCVIGQFNLGFIIARLGGELFIIDQHAADEKYNFERLQQVTRLNRQPMLQPQRLELTPAEAVTLREKLDVFQANGFDVTEGDDGQLLLTAVPYSKDTVFGLQDALELLHLLISQHPAPFQMSSQVAGQSSKVVRPSRVRAMLASRACRSSVMIGKALTTGQMQTILSHLSNLEYPWNCPHGRPTLRHLASIPEPE